MNACSRIRQVVLAARDLEQAAAELRTGLGLGEPFADPGVGYFGLRNAVFALGDTFIEVVSPATAGTAAGRLLERRGGDCGYMVMVQVPDLPAARERARAAGVREVFAVDLDDMAEVHLHPSDLRGAIVSLSSPVPAEAWRWGGPDWERRSVPGRVLGVRVGVSEPRAAAGRWEEVIEGLPGIAFDQDPADSGLVEISVAVATPPPRNPIEIGGVQFVVVDDGRKA